MSIAICEMRVVVADVLPAVRHPPATLPRKQDHGGGHCSLAFATSTWVLGTSPDSERERVIRITAAGKARWVWRGVVKGKRIEVGMGSTRFRSLKQAHEVAFEHTRTARLGRDPRAPAPSDVPTFAEAAAMYLEIQSPGWGGDHSRHVRRLLERHAFPSLGDLPVNEIQTADLMRVLVPLWRRQRPTGQRLRQRIAGVMAWSVAAGYRADDPTSTLSAVLPAGRRKRKHHRYVPAEELREALVKVQGLRGMDRDAAGDAVPGADGGAQRRGSGSEVAGGRSGVGHLDRSGLADEVPQGAQGSPLQRRPCGPGAGRWTAGSRASCFLAFRGRWSGRRCSAGC